VEGALDREEAGVAGEAVLDRAQERERADAEDDRRRHECLGHGPATAARRESTLERRAEVVETTVDAQLRSDDPAEQDAAEHVQEVRRVDRELRPHGQGEQADAPHDVLAEALGEPVAEDRAEQAAYEHGEGVEKRPRERRQVCVVCEGPCSRPNRSVSGPTSSQRWRARDWSSRQMTTTAIGFTACSRSEATWPR